MKLLQTVVVVLGISHFAVLSHASRNKWDAIYSMDSALTPPAGYTLSRPAKNNANVAAATGGSDYRRVAMQPPPPTPTPAPTGGREGTRIEAPAHLFIIATELDVPTNKARELSLALLSGSRDARTTISRFLRGWKQPGEIAASLVGLSAIADLIDHEVITTSPNWKFNLTPIPLSPAVTRGPIRPRLGEKPSSPLVFEIRMIIDVDKLGFPEAERATVVSQLAQMGVDNDAFLNAISALKRILKSEANAKTYPAAVAILETAFPSPR